MTSVVIIADSGAEMARLTATVDAAPGMVLVRHASGRAPVASIVADHQPAGRARRDVAAAPRARAPGRDPRVSPDSRIVVVAEDADARWLGSALGAGATAVIPAARGEALGTVLQEVLDADTAAAALMRRPRDREMSSSSHTPRKEALEMRVLIVVDNALTAEAIRREMRHAPTCRVIGYVNGRRPCALAIADAAPDLVVIDDAGEELDAAAHPRVPEHRPGGQGGPADGAHGRRAARGSSGRGHRLGDLQGAPPASVGLLIREVAAGNVFHAFARRTASTPVSSFLPNLTARELEILRWVAAGASNSAIARELFVTEQTVKFHLSNVYRARRPSPHGRATTPMSTGSSTPRRRSRCAPRCGPCRLRREPAHEIHGRPKEHEERISHPNHRAGRPTSSAGVLQGGFAGRRAWTRATPAVAASPAPSRAPSRATVRRCATSTSSTPTTSTATSPASSRTSTRPRTSPRWCSRSS